MKRAHVIFGVALLPLLVAGCGTKYTGEYTADVRPIEGAELSTKPGYTLEELRDKVAAENRRLVVKPGGRFVWHTGGSVNEGTWRVEGDAFILREDTYNGTSITPGLQKDRTWTIGADGEIITGSYEEHGLEECYVKQ